MLNDLRYAIRMLLKNPGFTIVAVLTLALGIGANTAIFSVVYSVLLRPLPYKNPARLVSLASKFGTSDQKFLVSPGDYLEWRDRNHVFEDVAAFEEAATANKRFNLTGGAEPERMNWAAVSVNLFPLLGVNASRGRTFIPEDEQPGRSFDAVVSNGFWRRRFGSDPNIVGKAITLNGSSYTVVGIMPPEFKLTYPQATDLWIPITFKPEERKDRASIVYRVIARLKPGVTITEAQAEMDQIARVLDLEGPQLYTKLGVVISPLHEEIVGASRRGLLILAGAVGFVLLIACVNVANLLFARATSRQRELAVRAAMGAGRFRLLQQLFLEGGLLAVTGGVIGLLLSVWGRDLLLTYIPANIPRAKEVAISGTVLGFTLLLSLLTGIVFSLLPALRASNPDLNSALQEAARSSTTGRRVRRINSILVISEVGLALVLLVAAGLMVKSFWRLLSVEPGFNPENVLTMQICLPWAKYSKDYQKSAFVTQLLDRVNSLPGVINASVTSAVPLRGVDYVYQFELPKPSNLERAARCRSIAPNYFQVMGIPLLRGRSFSEFDVKGSTNVVIIDSTFAQTFFPNEDAVGKHLVIDSSVEIVGVVGSVKNTSLASATEPAIYGPYSQNPTNLMRLVIRSASDPSGLSRVIASEVYALDKDQPIEEVATMTQILSDSVSDRRFNMTVLAAFASMALMLAAIGIYGVMSYTVTQRTHEIGVRMALGAQSGSVVKLVVVQGLKLALIGLGIGLIGALALTRVISSFLFGVTATDPVSFAAVSLILTGVAVLACYIPARRAARADPMAALRHE